MRRLAVLVCAVVFAACGSDSPTQPSNPNTVVFTATLNFANEVPVIPLPNVDSAATGTGTFTLNLTRSGTTITAATSTFVYSLAGFPAGTVIRATHIHRGGPGIQGNVVIDTGLSPATALTLANGTLTNQTFADRATDASLAQEILDNPNGFYFNVHSNVNTGGAVRGQLVKQ